MTNGERQPNNKFNDEKTNKFLGYLMNISYNKKCADCGKQNPSWATLTYAFFICYECSSLHRSLGVHRSKVKSTQMDAWTLEELRRMYIGGNKNIQRVTESSDVSIRYGDVDEFVEELDRKEEQSRRCEPGESFMDIPKGTIHSIQNVKVEKKAKPKFSDVVDSSSSEDAEVAPETQPTIEHENVSEERDVLIVSNPARIVKKTLNQSRSPFSFSIQKDGEEE